MSLPRLSQQLARGAEGRVAFPPLKSWDLPEKVLQFGTGRFLRSFFGDYVDRANRRGLFNGRIAVVQSTDHRGADLLNRQNGLYTLVVRGLARGEKVDSQRILSAISRGLSASREWGAVLQCAENPHLELIVSNTTEVGIRLDPDDSLELEPPRSFPGKLTALLHHRYQFFSGAPDKGVLVIPCELIIDNGRVLREIVLELARVWKLEPAFLDWVATANRFCNSLVDRIVTGSPEPKELERLWSQLGFSDELLTVAEPYSLWAIEGDQSVQSRLGFAESNPSIVVAPDISPYRERKLRLLNGIHTICSPASFLTGNDTILESMRDPLISRFIEGCMLREVAPSLDLDPESTLSFAQEVLERFRNPFLEHRLLDITFQSTSKMRLRVVPVIQSYCEKNRRPPLRLCLGFAFYLLFMKGAEKQGKQILGRREGQPYRINDDQAESFFERWSRVEESSQAQVRKLAREVCADTDLWGMDLTQLPGVTETVAESLLNPLRRLQELNQGEA